MLTVNENNIKNVAKKIGNLAAGKGCEIKHTEILNAIAAGFGHDSYQGLKSRFVVAQEPENYVQGPNHESYKAIFDKMLSLALQEGVDMDEAKIALTWFFEEVGCGIYGLDEEDHWYDDETIRRSGLKAFLLEWALYEIAWKLSREVGDIFSEYLPKMSGQEHLRELVKSGEIYDDKLLTILRTDAETFERVHAECRKEASSYYL